MRKKLEFQADRIEAVLALHEIPARVTGGTVIPRWVRFQVLPAVGARISKIRELSEELAAALDAPDVRVSRRGAAVAIELPRDDPLPVRLLPLYQQLTDGNPSTLSSKAITILGLSEDGAPMLIQLPSPNVGHILVTGTTGAGKTMLLQTMVLSLAMTNNSSDLAFVFLGDGLQVVAQALGQSHEVHRIERLDMAVLRAGFRTAGKRVIIVADDVTGNSERAVAQLTRLMQVDRRHYIVAWDGVPPAGIVNLFKARMVGRVTSVEDARTATGWSGTGAEQLAGRGDFLAMAEGRVTRFQVAHVSPAEIEEVGTRLAQGKQNDISSTVSLPPVSLRPVGRLLAEVFK